ncbi:MAG: sigma-70 family RNA polymerase sigma factor, partial [Acidobacteriota bacterium]
RRITDAIDSSLLEAVAEASQDRPEDRLFLADLENALATLSPKCQRLLRARYLEEEDVKTMAERFGYRESSVRKLCTRCLKRLVEAFDQRTGERSYRNVL